MCPNPAASMCVKLIYFFNIALLWTPVPSYFAAASYSAANPDQTHFRILVSGLWQFYPCFTTMLLCVILLRNSAWEFIQGRYHGHSRRSSMTRGGRSQIRRHSIDRWDGRWYRQTRSVPEPWTIFWSGTVVPKFQVFAKVSCAWVQIYTSERGIEPRSQGWEPCILTVRRFGIHTHDVSKVRKLDIKRIKKRKKEMWTQLWYYGTPADTHLKKETQKATHRFVLLCLPG